MNLCGDLNCNPALYKLTAKTTEEQLKIEEQFLISIHLELLFNLFNTLNSILITLS